MVNLKNTRLTCSNGVELPLRTTDPLMVCEQFFLVLFCIFIQSSRYVECESLASDSDTAQTEFFLASPKQNHPRCFL